MGLHPILISSFSSFYSLYLKTKLPGIPTLPSSSSNLHRRLVEQPNISFSSLEHQGAEEIIPSKFSFKPVSLLGVLQGHMRVYWDTYRVSYASENSHSTMDKKPWENYIFGALNLCKHSIA